MIILNKKFLYCNIAILTYFVIILTCISTFATTQNDWISNVFFDKVFLFLLTPIFAFIISFIGKSGNTTFFIRVGTKTHGIALLLIQQYIVALIYLTLWTISVCVFLLSIFGEISTIILGDILRIYLRYIWGYLIYINVSSMFSRVSSKQISSSPFACSYLLLVAEILVIYPTIDKMASVPNISLVYSWMFSSNPFATPILIVLVITTSLMNFYGYTCKDIY